MTDKPKVHFLAPHHFETACFLFTSNVACSAERRKVTCKNCKRSREYRTKERRS